MFTAWKCPKSLATVAGTKANQLVQQFHFRVGEGRLQRLLWVDAEGHGKPEDSPAQDAEVSRAWMTLNTSGA